MREKPRIINGAEPRKGLHTHEWPAPGEHLWSDWMPNTGVKPGMKATNWRKCLHPACDAVEVADV